MLHDKLGKGKSKVGRPTKASVRDRYVQKHGEQAVAVVERYAHKDAADMKEEGFEECLRVTKRQRPDLFVPKGEE